MTNTGGTPAGWYHAPGDPEGTQRYWDGGQWVGEPQAAAQQPPQQQAAPQPASQAPPAYGAPGAASAAAPAGYQAFGSSGPGVPAEWGQRAIAYLIDLAPVIGAYIVAAILSSIADVLAILGLLLNLAAFGFIIWNLYIRQGSTGQSIGKEKQGIKLVSDATGQPVGGLMAFVRYLVAGAFALLCCIGQFVNLLAPLWNADKKTYSDKIMKMSVVKAD